MKYFPFSYNVHFPKNIKQTTKVIFKRLFRIYAYILYSFSTYCNAWLPISFKYLLIAFYFFIERLNLVEPKELAPLELLIQKFKERRNEQNGKV